MLESNTNPTTAEQVPNQMNVWILEAPLRLRWESCQIPDPAEGEVLLRVKVATTCGTDLKAFIRGHSQIPMPGPLGHEYAGVVAKTGKNSKFQVGDEVYGVHTAPCKNCQWCQIGQENLCDTIMQTKVMGAYAEYLLIPRRIADTHLFIKPPSLPFATSALLEPLSCVMQGIECLKPRRSDAIAIIGPGAIGLMFALALVAKGVSNVTLYGRSPDRLHLATDLGIDAKPLKSITTNSFDCVIECTGTQEIWEKSPDWVRRGGKVLLFGGLPAGTKVAFDAARLHYDQIDLLDCFHFGTSAVMEAKSLLETGKIDLDKIITAERPLKELPHTFDELKNRIGLKYAMIP